MISKKNKRNNQNTALKDKIIQNNQMNRFLRDIAREDALETNTLEMMLAYQPVRIR